MIPSRHNGVLLCAALFFLLNAFPTFAQVSLEETIRQIAGRPEFAHANIGVEVLPLDGGEPLFRMNENKLFVPASTTKLLTEGSALELLGGDYRFHTRVYRTGPVAKGTLKGDLVMVASGDPNLSNRIQTNGTLAFENNDHSYDGSPATKAVPGDPLAVLRELAGKVADAGVRRITGRALVDASLFPEGTRELGTNVVISPVVVNDNVVDVTVTPGAAPGERVSLTVSPQTAYVRFVNQAATGAEKSKPDIRWEKDEASPDGSRTVTVAGTLAPGKPILYVYAVPSPTQFAQLAFAQALGEKGVRVEGTAAQTAADFKILAMSYQPENLLAEHVSPPFSEEVKVTLKVSQNLHASMTPYILGAALAHKMEKIDQAGFDLEHEFLKKAGLDLSSAAQADGAGGDAYFTPDFMAHYLAFMAKQKDFQKFYDALPVMGRDGTLWNIETASPAAGHVHAKTGTDVSYDALNHSLVVKGKGLAGYVDLPDGQRVIMAAYANMVPVPFDDEAPQRIAGQALGQIASAVYGGGARPSYDVLLRGGHVIDGSGNPWYAADVAITGDRVAAIGDLRRATAKQVIDAAGLVVAPGFIDMLGQSEMALLIDNRSFSKLSQGITSEITGEGNSIAPQNARTIAAAKPFLDQYHLTVDWTDLEGYWKRLAKAGTPLNVGTYVGAAQVREAMIGDDDRAPTPQELEQMKAMVAQAMQQGALGLSTALIYPPGHYARTEELIELAKVAAQYGGLYATHMRSEGQSEMQAIDEAIRIGREAGLPVEIFHLKVSGKSRWGSMTQVVAKIQAARDSGLDIAADMYPYVAGATALASSLPPWVADGGLPKLLERLRDPAIRQRIAADLAQPHAGWENLYRDCGGGSGVMLSGVVNPQLKKYDGKTVAEMAKAEGKPEMDALFDFILADEGRTGALYFMASEQDNLYGLKQPWTSVGLDADETSLDGPLYQPHTHPRAWGSMPRGLGRFVRDQTLMPLEQAVRKVTSLPAQRERLQDRGLLKPGYYADVTVFDPATLMDKATFERPDQASRGVEYVFVNGQLEFAHGKLTGITAGRPLKGRAAK